MLGEWIEFRATAADVERYFLFGVRRWERRALRHPAMKPLAIVAVLLLLVLVLAVSLGPENNRTHFFANPVTWLVLGIGATLIAVYAWGRIAQPRLSARRVREAELPHRVRLTREGVECVSSEATAMVKWSAIEAFEQDDQLFYFWLRDNQAVFVPQRAFSDESACGAFCTAACDAMSRSNEPPAEATAEVQG